MSSAQDLALISEDAPEDVIFPPGDLYSDEPPLETELHLRQILLLIQCLEWCWKERQDFYACGNMTVYYSPRQRKSEQFRGPDFFVVLNSDRKTRKSWVVWEEDGKYPNVIVEILSDKTASTDRGLKKEIYQDIWRTPDYFWFDPDSLEFKGFHLLDGRYQPLQANEAGLLWSQQLELYLGVHQSKLRFFTADGQLVPTPEEVAQQEQQQRQQAEQERQQAQQQLAEMEAMLARYKERFGELPE
ncbi:MULTISPECIES: Uma2 family endonuclease [Calothrix]|uniref:Uma2 family endonuclease n=2 Tax=Calothrix TaxID=1186 RepID=A0ABR8A3I9_9CYAN|nr:MULTISPECIES: Uma2 family endonuclease [Calothrix]MBD2194429.1 Uma2 family endonuclease [Calothrix parietina FACHB-288]MBD2223211.1 Uma2 family endonuclease [Calothrix anomala FACHB-343]